MTHEDNLIVRHLAQIIAERVLAMHRDGLANSKGHLDSIDECARAIFDITMGTRPNLPL